MRADSRPLLSRFYVAVTLGVACAALFFAAWVVAPAPSVALLPLGVGAPELSPLWVGAGAAAALLAAGGLVWVASVRRVARRALGAALALGAAATVIAMTPLARLPGAASRFDAAMAAALGDGYEALVPPAFAARARRSRFTVRELFGVRPEGDSVVVTRGVPFATRDSGPPLRMDVHRPPGGAGRPTLVVIYGGAWQRGDPSRNPELTRYMAARGYVVFAVDYRHAPAHRFPAQLEDVRDALRYVSAHAAEYGADSARIVLLGRSSGAHLALLAAYEPGAPPVRAVVDYYGPTDLAEGYRDPPRPDPLDVRAILRDLLGGTPDELPDAYRLASPVSYAARTAPPTLIVHGARDHVVLARFGRELHDRLRAAGATSVLLEIPWAEHAFDELFGGLSNQLALYYTERFVGWSVR